MLSPLLAALNVKTLSILVGGLGVAAVAALGLNSALSRPQTATAQQQRGPAGQAGAIVETAPVALGSISAAFGYAGSIQASRQVSVTPKVSGLIEDIYVDVGDYVGRGDPLARIDRGVLPAQLQQAQASLQAANARFALVRAGARPEDVAAAQAQLEQARARLVGLQQPRSEDVEAAEAQLRAAEARLEGLRFGRAEDVAAVEAQIRSAQARLDQFLSGGRAEDIGSARAQLDAAQARLEQILNPSIADLLSAQQAVAQAETVVERAETDLANLQSGARQADLRAQQSAVTRERALLRSAQLNRDALCGHIGERHPTASRDITTLDCDTAEAAVAAAGAALSRETARLDSVRAPSTSTEAAERNLSAARTQLAAAEAKLEQLVRPREVDLIAARATVEQAQQNLLLRQQPFTQAEITAQRELVDQLRAQLQARVQPGSPADIEQQQEVVNQLRAQLQARVQPGSPADLTQQEQVVAQMQAQLHSRANPFTNADLQAAVAQVAQAEAGVALAQANLEQTLITAPFEGIVAQRPLSAGAIASAQTSIVTLVSPEVEIRLTVEEARLSQILPGQTVLLSVPAYPGVMFEGSVTSISPTGDARAHTFDAKIVPLDQDERLKPGMFAQVEVLVAQKTDAVLVPRSAVVQREGGANVFVAEGGRARARVVQVGFTDDRNAEIVSGVVPGEQVVVVGQFGLRDGDAVRTAGQAPQGQQRAPGGEGGQQPARPGG